MKAIAILCLSFGIVFVTGKIYILTDDLLLTAAIAAILFGIFIFLIEIENK